MADQSTDVTDTPPPPSAVSGGVADGTDAAVRNELLCFCQNKAPIMAFDHIVKLVTDFYTKDEIYAAKIILEQYLPSGVRLSRRQGSSAAKATVEDVLKIVLNPQVKVPVFYAVVMDRLPPVDVSHCDVSAILRELQLLRSEVRAVNELRQEVCNLSGELQKMRAEVDDLQQKLMMPSSPAADAQWPSLPMPAVSVDGMNTQSLPSVSTRMPFAVHAQSLASQPGAINNKPARKPVVGKSNDLKLTSVSTTRAVDLFVSRLHPATTRSEVKDCVQMIIADNAISAAEITCESLKPKIEGLYASFYVAVRVDSVVMSHAIEVLMNADYWPKGVFIKRYFKPKNGNSQ